MVLERRLGAARNSLLALVAAAGLSLANAAGAEAQQGSVSGSVVDASNLQPAVGAQVFFPDLEIGTFTDEEGRYRLTGVPAGSHTLRVRLLGYRSVSREVTVRAGETTTADFELAVSAVQLGEIVVTQTGGQERRAMGANITTIQAEDEVAKSQPAGFQDLLKGRSAGALVRPSGGSVGTSNTFQIRGNASINLSNTPIIYVDGVLVNNNNTVGDDDFGVGGQTTSRLNDLNPGDIASMQVLKGASASTLYGSEAAGGVILITTKSGGAETRYSVRARAGANFDAAEYQNLAWNPARSTNPLGGFFGGLGVAPRDTTYLIDLVEEDAADIPFNQTPYKTGFEQGVAANVRGSLGEGSTFYLSGEFEDRAGNTDPNGVEKLSLRGNFNFSPSDEVDISLSNGFTNNSTLLPLGDNGGGIVADTWSNFEFIAPLRKSDPNAGGASVLTCPFEAELARSTGLSIADFRSFAVSAIGAFPCTGFGSFSSIPGNPELGAPWLSSFRPQEWTSLTTTTDVQRYTGSVNLSYRPIDWLTTRFTAGIDLTAQEEKQLQAVRPELVSIDEDFTGVIERQNANTSVLTLQSNTTAEFDLTDELTSRTTAGVQYNQNVSDGVFAEGQQFPAGSPAVNNSVQQFANDFFIETRTIGLFAEQRFGWRNRLFLTAGLRADDAAQFGGELPMQVFGQVNGSYVISEEEWFPDVFETLRLRAAFGESGSQPGPNAALALFNSGPTPFRGSDLLAVSPTRPGNPELSSERSREIEAGFDVSLLDGRLGGEFTWYRQVTEDAVISAPVPVSTGFPNAPFTNLGEMENKGIEAALDWTALSRPDIQWNWRGQVSTNYNRINELESPIIFGFGLSTTTNRHAEGEEFSSLYGFDPFINEAGEVELPDTNGDGSPDPEILGSGTPNVNGSLSSTLTLFEHVTLYGMAEWATGHQQWSLTDLFHCGFLSGLIECEGNFETGSDGVLTDRARLVTFGAQGGHIGPFVQDADWIKLRTVSIRLTAPDSWTRFFGGHDLSLSLTGQNLAIWTGFTGPDPELTSLNPANFGAARVSFRTIPPPRRYTAELSLSF